MRGWGHAVQVHAGMLTAALYDECEGRYACRGFAVTTHKRENMQVPEAIGLSGCRCTQVWVCMQRTCNNNKKKKRKHTRKRYDCAAMVWSMLLVRAVIPPMRVAAALLQTQDECRHLG